MSIGIVYIVFVLMSLASFRVWRAPVAALAVFLGGWLLLPVGHFPAGSAESFPYWITGLAVPSDMLLTKAWLAPAAAVAGAIIFDRSAWHTLRPGWIDVPVVLLCAWPVLQQAIVGEAHPVGLLDSLYLAGCWGLPWLLGRLYCATEAGRLLLVKALAISGAACVLFSLVEGVVGPVMYGWFYEPHPFRLDGAVRRIGYRPIGFFEHGNQFGLWVCLCALAALWLAITFPLGREGWWYRALAIVGVMVALAAQSLGAILLLSFGLSFLLASRYLRPRKMAAAAVASLMLLGAVYVSGVLPIARLAKDSGLGQQVVATLQSVGGRSFTWRIGQDQKLRADATANLLTGTANWEWWRPKEARPWGLTLLVLGQFGLPGLMLYLGTLLVPSFSAAWRAPRGSPWQPSALPLLLATIPALAVLDATMNSFIFFPAITVAGALAATSHDSAEDCPNFKAPAALEP